MQRNWLFTDSDQGAMKLLQLASRFLTIQANSVALLDREPVGLVNADGTPTIGHEILTLDNPVVPTPEAALAKFNATLNAIVSKIQIDTMPATVIEATELLTRIESVITEQNFACSIPYFLVENFSGGLLPRSLDPRLANVEENRRRRDQMVKHANELFSVVDCDLSSLLYLSIADKLQLPLAMVEVPQHNFVRWVFDNGLPPLNWDTNYGFSRFTDDEYAQIYQAPTDPIAAGVFLANMSREAVLGYFNFCRGIAWQAIKDYENALAEYRRGIAAHPKSSGPRNNAAWLFASSRKAQQFISAGEAIDFAERAVQLYKNASALDTLGCCYAEAGDFDKALLAEKEAFQLEPTPDYQRMIEAFENRRTYLDLFPEIL